MDIPYFGSQPTRTTMRGPGAGAIGWKGKRVTGRAPSRGAGQSVCTSTTLRSSPRRAIMSIRTSAHFVLCFFAVSVAPVLAATQIAAIPFETVPTQTTFTGPAIDLNGNTAVTGDLNLTGD